MTTFDNRERGYEDKFAHDSDLEFRVISRRNKLIAQWAAEKFGFSGPDAEAYVKSVIADATKPGAEGIHSRLLREMTAKSLGIPETEINDRIRQVEATARKQLLEEG